MCPGRRKSCGWAPGSTHFMAVIDRSAAEMPVVVSTWSIDTVKAVSWLSVLRATICGRASLAMVHGHANEAFGVGCHEVDVLGGGELRRANEVAFVFTLGVVGTHDEAAGA